MIKELSKPNRLKAEHGDKQVPSYTAEDMKVILEMNKELEEFRREYKIKDKKSHVSAANVILTA